jgi:type IV pilus assembly protein PilA
MVPLPERAGKQRSPGMVATLGLFTLGIYWVFWFYSVSRQLGELRGTDRRPGLRALFFFLAVTPPGYWLVSITISPLIMRIVWSNDFLMPLLFYCSMAALGTYLLTSAAKDIQALHAESGSSSGFRRPTGYALASQLGPFVIPFFVARLQSELNRYIKIRGVTSDGPSFSVDPELLRPLPLPRLAIASAVSGIVLFTIAILAAIAIPSFSSFRVRGYDAAAQADLRNAKTCAESYFADYAVYPVRLDETAGAGCGQISTGVRLLYQKKGPDKYLITSSHEKGSKEYQSSEDMIIYSRKKNMPDSEWQRQ